VEFNARSMTSTSFIFSSRRDKRALSASNICMSEEISPKSSRFRNSSSSKEFRSFDHRFWELAKAFFNASTSLLSLDIVDSFRLDFGDISDPVVNEVTEPSFGLYVRSETVFVSIAHAVPSAVEEGEPVGVGVEIIDNFDPPLWCPDDDDGVCDLVGEYCCSRLEAIRGDFSFDLVDGGGRGGSLYPTFVVPLDFVDSSS